MVNKEMVKEKSWKEFRETGLLWFINTILHTFGWTIVIEYDDDNNNVKAFPARTRYRGFSQRSNDTNYLNLTRYMASNSEELLKEVEEEYYNEEENA